MYTLNIDWLAINWYSFTSQQTRIYSRWKDFFVKIVDNKLYFIFSLFSSLGHATLHLDPSVCQSVSILNYERVSHYCSCPSHCDWIAMYPVFFLVSFCQIHFSFFLVACTWLYNRLCPSVSWSFTYFFYDFYSLTSLLLPKWSSDLKYGPCPPARDFGSRVSRRNKAKWGHRVNHRTNALPNQ